MGKKTGDLRDISLVVLFALLSVGLWFLPTWFEERVETKAVRCRGEVIDVDNSTFLQIAMIRTGDQGVTSKFPGGPPQAE